MNTETEIKFYVQHLDQVQARLETLGATLIQPRTFESNLRFDLPDRTLSRSFETLRLRQDSAARLTYKGPSETVEGVRSRLELEVTVSDFETTQLILEMLGYEVMAVYEKYRQVYELDGLHIFLDELPYGNFVEIEGDTPKKVQSAARRLDLEPGAAIQGSYLSLGEGLCAARGLDPSKLTFEALAGLNVEPKHLKVRAADQP